MGKVYNELKQHNKALNYHQADLQISNESSDGQGQVRALENIGVTFEHMGDLDEAIKHHELQLAVASQNDDLEGKTRALAALGRIHHNIGQMDPAISFLQQGLAGLEAEEGSSVDEAIIRHRLGLILWQTSQDLDDARKQLNTAANLLDGIRKTATGKDQLVYFDLQTECYAILQRILVTLNLENEALVVAEKSRTRAFMDLIVERKSKKLQQSTQISSEADIVNLVNRQKASILYFSIAAGYLYSWLIVPTKGIVKFHEVCIESPQSENVLVQHIQNVRESLGVDPGAGVQGDDGEEGMWSSHLDALGDKLNQDSDRSGFLRMVNRSSKLNASSYSLSSLFSVGSVNCGSTISGVSKVRSSAKRNVGPLWQGPSSLKALYELLLEPMEDDLPEGYPCELVLVLEGDLYLVPFPMLRGTMSSASPEYLCERFSLLVAPSLTAIKNAKSKNLKNEQPSSTLIVGNPKMPSSISEHWGWTDIPYSGQEADIVAEIMQSQSLTGERATKQNVLSELSEAECVHFACHVSWKLSALVLSPGEFVESKSDSPQSSSKKFDVIHEEHGEVASTIAGDAPPLSEFLLTAADILNLKLNNCKLVVLSTCYTRDEQHGAITTDGLIALSRALLAAGAQCVLISLWPVPDTAVKLIMKALYSSLLQGARVSRALADAMTTVQTTKHFQHPANWASFMLIGSDVKLSNKVALMGQALRDILATPEACRDALRVTLHLVEKSLQRINRHYKNAMYTSQKSIENKIGGDGVKGWKDLLISVGFRFEPATNGIPPSVFFPQCDPGERLTQCSASLQALLGLNQTSWAALSKLLDSNTDAVDEIIALFRQVTVLMSSSRDSCQDPVIEVPVNVKLWRVPGCHELLASLGFDLMDVGNQDVILKTGKSANKRQIHYGLQALLALFETQDAPRSLEIEEISEEDDEVDQPDQELDASPFSILRKGGSIVIEGSSAFSNYVRKRGEPDGRQAGNNDSPTQPSGPYQQAPSFAPQQTPAIPPPPIPPIPSMMLYSGNQTQHIKGHESDCNFTPSPVDPVFPRNGFGSTSKMFGTLPSDQGSPIQRPYVGQYRHGYLGRPESSSSVSSFERNDHNHGGHNLPSMRKPVILKGGQPHHQHHGGTVQQRINQALDLISSDVSSVSREKMYAVPLYENTAMEFTARQPAGKPVTPIRSVFTDVGYHSNQRKILQDTSDPNDKFSVRTETGRNLGMASTASTTSVNSGSSSATSSNKVPMTAAEARLNPGVIKRVPPTGESGSPETTNNDQNRGLGNIPLMSDVYHERNMGLGMAPPLSKLIMSSNLQVVQVEHHSDSDSNRATPKSQLRPQQKQEVLNEDSLNSIDNLSVIEEAHQRNSIASSARTVIIKEDTGLPSQPSIGHHKPPVLPAAVVPPLVKRKPVALPRFSNDSNQQPWYKRDEGDGRSMTDSQYSGYSPGGGTKSPPGATKPSLASRINHLKLKDYMNDQEITVLEEKEIPEKAELQATYSPAYDHDEGRFRPVPAQPSGLRPLEVAHYINTQYKMPPVVSSTQTPSPKVRGNEIARDTKHPQQIWSRDGNGGLTYTGMFSSDC